MRCCGVKLRVDSGTFSGEINFLQWHRVGQQVTARRVPSLVAVLLKLRRTLVVKSPVPAPRKVEIPAAELVHPRPGRIRAGQGNTRHRPQHVEKIPAVPAVALRPVGGHAHAGEKLRAFLFTEQVEQDGGHPALAVVIMDRNTRVMVTVGNRTLSDVETQQLRTTLDREILCRIFHASLTRQNKCNGEWHAWRIHHSVAAKPTALYRKPMTPRTDGTLTPGGFQRETPQPRHDRLIACRHHILREQQHDVAVIPCLHTVLREICRGPFRLALHQREIGGITTG